MKRRQWGLGESLEAEGIEGQVLFAVGRLEGLEALKVRLPGPC